MQSFPVTDYQVQGDTLLGADKIRQATQPHTSPQATFETIQQALESLEKAYVSAGYGSVRVEIPEQEIEAGVVTLQVIEGVLADIIIEAHPHFDADNIRHSVPALNPAQTVNIKALNRNLMLANEGGAKVTNVTFKSSANHRDVDAVIKVTADNPVRWLALADNTGAESTGRLRTGLVYQNVNLFNRDHSLALQWMTSPDHLDDVRILGLSYRVPLYHLGDMLDFNASSSSVNSGQVSSAGGGPDLAISGSGLMLGARYTHNFEASAELQQSVNVGLEYRAYGNTVTPVDQQASLVPDLTTRPFTLGYSANWRSASRDVSASLTWLKNLPGGANGSTADFNQDGGRTGADANFQTLKFSLQHTERFGSQWLLRTALSGQATPDLLIAAEQFGVGGADSVRGFGEREVAGDQGLRAGLEVWAPPVNTDPWRMIPLAFIDAAWVKRNQPAAGEISSQSISSVGIGLRGAYGSHLTGRLDWGYVLKGVNGIAGPVRSDHKLHASMAWVF
ncbi:MAG: ShlB/FhaC/HecB family hemolysin secretion/activation protein [Rhodoferax sp.]